MLFARLIKESILFALQSIIVNKLRTMLSLLGISIGIFAIISVFTIVDSLEQNIRTSIESLGDNVIFIQKWPWEFGGDYKWWQYMNRPNATIKEVDEIKRKSIYSEAVVFSVSTNTTIEYLSNSMENVFAFAVTHDYDKVRSFDIIQGRYFSELESNRGSNVCIIGYDIMENLMQSKDVVGKHIKIFGRKLTIIGVFGKEGENSFGESSDNLLLIPVNYMRNIIDVKSERYGPMIWVKAKEGVSNEELKDELKGIMRAIRKLKPLADDNFALNETSLLTQGFEGLFKIVTLAGWIIGCFSILVGGFGIANIMFVSVKERTGIIGIQKSVGAKRYFILFEFLIEAIILCIIGGLVGLIIVFAGTLITSAFIDMKIYLTWSNIILGINVSVIIGLISGFLPAYRASKLNPVEAIRANQ